MAGRFGLQVARSSLIAVVATLMAPAAATTGQRVETGVTGRIRGMVQVLRTAPVAARRPSVSDLGMSGRSDPGDRPQTIVYLEKAPAGAFDERPSDRARMTQRNERFAPQVLAIRAGTTVDFPNEDQTYHNVFSLSKTRRFDLGRYAAGMSKPVRFDQPGIVRVFCDIHSHMSAFILVFNHHYFDATDADGRYDIPAVPPGRYTVLAWHEGTVRDAQAVTVPEQGGIVEVNFELR
jgi:plastocyanin